MTKDQFKKAFRRGLGSAIVELKTCNCREKYTDIVLWCCLHNTCYDAQCEGGRGIYLYNAICLFGDKDIFETEIINKFSRRKLESWLFEQLCNLLCRFAMDGSVKAREALYEKYNVIFLTLSDKRHVESYSIDRDNFEWLCIWLTSLDGFRAYKRIVEQVGKYYLNAKDARVISLDWFNSNAKNEFGKTRIENYLQNRSGKSKEIAAFLTETESLERYKPQLIPVPSLKDLVEACREPSGYRSRSIALRFARTASEAELTELAKIAVEETNLDVKLELLWVFRKKPFLYMEKILISFYFCFFLRSIISTGLCEKSTPSSNALDVAVDYIVPWG